MSRMFLELPHFRDDTEKVELGTDHVAGATDDFLAEELDGCEV